MCGRYSLEATSEQIVEAFALADAIAIKPRYNIAPTQDIPIVRVSTERGDRRLVMTRWGLSPSWWNGQRPLINARSETVQKKFPRAFNGRRCLVPATGFYEWQKLGQAKQPFHIQRADRGLFAFAGLWDRCPGPDGEMFEACAILTTTPNKTVEPVHDRMPVILAPAAYAAWLDPGMPDPSLLAPAPDDLLDAYPVGRRVNRTANDDAACVEPMMRQSQPFNEELF